MAISKKTLAEAYRKQAKSVASASGVAKKKLKYRRKRRNGAANHRYLKLGEKRLSMAGSWLSKIV
jgi:hypothetical protein